MKISIVTISFNQLRFLERAIRSVLDQDYPDIEYIVVDPGSEDGSRDVIQQYGDRIQKVIFEPDNGPAAGLNKGFRSATGEILGYLNSDDAYLPGAFSKIAEAFTQHPDADVIYGHGYVVDGQGKRLRRFYSDSFNPWRLVHGACDVMQPSTFFRREAFAKVGGFNQDNGITWDSELLLDFAATGMRMHAVNDFLSIFTLHEQSISWQRFSDTPRAKVLKRERMCANRRLYERVTGHSYNLWSKMLVPVAKTQKWLLHPEAAIWRFIDRVLLGSRA